MLAPFPVTQQGVTCAYTISHVLAVMQRKPKHTCPQFWCQLLCSKGLLLCPLEHHCIILLPLQGGVGPWNYHPQEIRAILEKLK